MPRYFAIAVVLTLIGFAIIGKAMYIMTAKKTYWTQVATYMRELGLTIRAREHIRSLTPEVSDDNPLKNYLQGDGNMG